MFATLTAIASHSVIAQGTPVPVVPRACAHLRDAIATPVTSPTIAQSTAGMNRASLALAVETLVACRNDGDWTTFLSLHEQTYLSATYGSSDYETVSSMLAELAQSGYLLPFELVASGEPVVTGRTATVAVTTREGYILRRTEWRFVKSDERWLLSGSTPQPPLLDVNAVGIPVTLSASGVTATRGHLVNPGAVILRLENTLSSAVPFALFANPDHVDPEEFVSLLIDGHVPGNDVLGWELVPGATSLDLVLSELPDGAYVVVAGFDPRNPPAALNAGNAIGLTITS